MKQEFLYDLRAEERLVTHLLDNPSDSLKPPFHPSLLSGEREELAVAITKLQQTRTAVSVPNLQAINTPNEAVLLAEGLLEQEREIADFKLLCSTLKDKAVARTLAQACTEIHSEVVNGRTTGSKDIRDLMEKTLNKVSTLMRDRSVETMQHVSNLREAVDDLEWRATNPGRIMGYSSGMAELDHIVDMMRPGKLIYIGARPSVGKTALLGKMSASLCRDGIPNVIFSAEMTRPQLQSRMITDESRVSLTGSVRYTKQDLIKIQNAVGSIQKWPLWIDDLDRPSISYIQSKVREMVAKHGVKVVFVDYVQLIRGVEPASHRDRRIEVGEVSGKLKGIAKECGVTVIALAQLTRIGRKFDSTLGRDVLSRPNLENLKESGDLEQDADAVLLLSRDPQYNPTEAELIVAKSRFSSCGTVNLNFIPELTLFEVDPHPRNN